MRTLSLLAAIALSACSPSRGDVSLRSFESCEAMDSYMETMAYREARYRFREEFNLGIFRGGSKDMWDVATEEYDVAPQAAGSYSTTNLQEGGVDEADLVKTDGTHLFSLAGNSLVISRVFPMEDAGQLSVTPFDGQAYGLYLVEGRVIVLSVLRWESPNPRSGAAADWQPGEDTVVTVINVTDPAAPVVERETYATGTLDSTRRIGDQLYVVTYRDLMVGEDVYSHGEARDAIAAAEDEDWRSRTMDNVRSGDSWETDTGPACGCEETYASEAQGGTFVTTVLSLDLSDPLSEFRGTAVVGRADTVYASTDSIFVAYAESEEGPWGVGSEVHSVIHKFHLAGEAPAYAATAELPGSIDDSFSLSEYNGILRVATTVLDPNLDSDQDWVTSSASLFTLEEVGGVFNELDRVEDLAPGEEVTAARFIGDVGYVSTAVRVVFQDPLFTFDLSDPSDIQVGGSLEIPGFSDYLHPMDEDHLLAVGMDAEGLQVSIFDVGDLSNPQLAQRIFLDSWGSEAQFEHHAFNYFAPTESLSLPMWSWEGETVLKVVHVTPDLLENYGDLHQPSSFAQGDDAWCSFIQRSVVMEDVVWAVSGAGLTAAKVAEPGTPLVTLPFTGVNPCESVYYY